MMKKKESRTCSNIDKDIFFYIFPHSYRDISLYLGREGVGLVQDGCIITRLDHIQGGERFSVAAVVKKGRLYFNLEKLH